MIEGLENIILEAMENNNKLASSTNKIVETLKGKVSSYNLYLLKILPEIMEWNLSFLDMIQDVIDEDTIQEMDEDEINRILDSVFSDLKSYFFNFLDGIDLPEDILDQISKMYLANEYMLENLYLNTLNKEIKDLKNNYIQEDIIREELNELQEEKENTENFLEKHKNWKL